MDYSQTAHWKLVTVLCRVTGAAFILGGIVFSIYGARLLNDPKSTLAVDGSLTTDPYMKAIVLGAGVVTTALGFLLLFARSKRETK